MLRNSSYKTGIDEIDKQNYDLIDRVDEMMNTEDNGERLKQLGIFEELVKKYFEREQRLHNECRYFDSYWHHIIHELYITKLLHTKQIFTEAGATPGNKEIFRRQVVEFLKDHIMCHDRSFANFYNNIILLENRAG